MAIQTALPRVGNSNVGVRTAFGVLLPPGSKVAAYVGAIQDDALDAYSVSTLLVPTLQAGLARCRAGKGDVVVVLPGHTESVSTADFFSNLVAGTQILGCAPPNSSLMPTLLFTATAATFLLDATDVTLSGIKFACGIDAVASYVTVSSPGCTISDCYFQTGISSVLDVSTAVIVAAGGNDCRIVNNRFAGTGTAVNQNCITVLGAVDGLQIINNDFDFQALGALQGAIEFGAVAATQFRILRNNIVNRRATAGVAVRWTDTAGLAGIIAENNLAFTADITAATAALSAAGSTNHAVRAFDNLVHDENQGTAIPALITSAATIE